MKSTKLGHLAFFICTQRDAKVPKSHPSVLSFLTLYIEPFHALGIALIEEMFSSECDFWTQGTNEKGLRAEWRLGGQDCHQFHWMQKLRESNIYSHHLFTF